MWELLAEISLGRAMCEVGCADADDGMCPREAAGLATAIGEPFQACARHLAILAVEAGAIVRDLSGRFMKAPVDDPCDVGDFDEIEPE